MEFSPRPVHDGRWVDPAGVEWRRRGAPLEPRAIRRLAGDDDLIVVHVDELDVVEATGSERSRVLADLADWLDGRADVHTDYVAGEFRDSDRRRMLILERSC